MSEYTIITDSATDTPQWVKDRYGIRVIPTPVVIDGTDYFDGETIKTDEFYDILRSGTNVTTYHINQYMFYTNFEPYAKAGKDLVYFCFSTGIAGTFNAANLAKAELLEKYPDFKLDIIDSKGASVGFGVTVLMALMMQERGASKEEVIEAAKFHFEHMEYIFTVETLEYLYKGGRLSRTAAIAGGLLDIKPILEVTDEGKLEAFEKVRGRKKAINRVLEIVGERGADLGDQIMAVVHADCPDVAEELKTELKARYGSSKFFTGFLGCAIGAHTGPGLVAVCFLNAESPYKKYFTEYNSICPDAANK